MDTCSTTPQFPSTHGVNISVAVLIQVSAPKRVVRWQQTKAYPPGADFSLKVCMGFITRHYRKEENWWFPGANISPSVMTQPLVLEGKTASLKTEMLREEWGWRMLLFEPRRANPPEITGIWLYYSQCFPKLDFSPFLHPLSYPGYRFLN